MRILYLSGGNLAKKRGYTVHTAELARNFEKLGAEILVYAPSLGRFKGEGFRIAYAPTVNVRILRPVSFRLSLGAMLFFRLLFYGADIIYVREIPLFLAPFIMGRIFKKPTVIEVNDVAIDGFIGRPKNVFSRLKFYMRKISFLLSYRIIVANRQAKEILSEKYGICPDKFAVIPMGVNTDLFRPMDKNKCKDVLGLKEGVNYVVFAGTLYEFQGLRYLVEAAHLVLRKKRNVKFLVVGSGAEEKKLNSLVKRKNLAESFIFAGEKDYGVIPYYINSGDICVSLVTPERSRSFSFPLKIYEYLACARPVVAGNIKNASELLKRTVTPVVEATDPGILSNAIIEILECSSALKAESEQLRRLVAERFTWQKTAEKTLDLFRSLQK